MRPPASSQPPSGLLPRNLCPGVHDRRPPLPSPQRPPSAPATTSDPTAPLPSQPPPSQQSLHPSNPSIPAIPPSQRSLHPSNPSIPAIPPSQLPPLIQPAPCSSPALYPGPSPDQQPLVAPHARPDRNIHPLSYIVKAPLVSSDSRHPVGKIDTFPCLPHQICG